MLNKRLLTYLLISWE